MINPIKSLEAQIDAMVEADLEFDRECRGEIESTVFPEQEDFDFDA